MLMPHIFHQIRSYAEWTQEAFGRTAGPFAGLPDEAAVRKNPAFQVLTPEQTLAMAENLGPEGVLYLNPLLAGIDPRRARRMLDLYERAVHPHLPR